VKPGVRALGIAESYRGTDGESTLCGAVVRADRTVDGFVFDSCTVGGTDATDAITTLYRRLDREDVQYVLIAGLALAWYNVVDLWALAAALDRPVLSITFEASTEGLEAGLRGAFSGMALTERRAIYDRQPPRQPVDVGEGVVFYRSVGRPDGDAATIIREFTPEGGRPEPLRVARLAARAADRWAGADDGPA
jgi:uncharacterized protein